jgi:hypothetical protein
MVFNATELLQDTDKLYHIMLYEYTSPWSGFELTTLVVIGTDSTILNTSQRNYSMSNIMKKGLFTKISCKIFYETAQPIWTKLCHCVVPILNCIQLVLAPSKMATVTKTKTLMVNGPKQLYLKPESAKIVTWRSWLGALWHIFLLLWSISEIRHIFFRFVQVNDTEDFAWYFGK